MTMDPLPMRVLQLVPPGSGGVRDYADTLRASGLGGDVLDVAAPVAVDWNNYDMVLVQYSGYGYSRRGAPQWLAEWLRESRRSIRRLGFFFHELYAPSLPWQSAFWFSPLQRRVARNLCALSDFWLTNRSASAGWLLGHPRAQQCHVVLPTPSNVGEANIFPATDRKNLLVFGGADLRKQTYELHGRTLFKLATDHGLEIHDVGPLIKSDRTRDLLAKHGVHVHGHQPVNAMNAMFNRAAMGFLTYALPYASKSGVLGAYCAYGVCPVIFPHRKGGGAPADGLQSGFNFIDGSKLRELNLAQAAEVAGNAYQWYQAHCISKHVDAVEAFATGRIVH